MNESADSIQRSPNVSLTTPPSCLIPERTDDRVVAKLSCVQLPTQLATSAEKREDLRRSIGKSTFAGLTGRLKRLDDNKVGEAHTRQSPLGVIGHGDNPGCHDDAGCAYDFDRPLCSLRNNPLLRAVWIGL